MGKAIDLPDPLDARSPLNGASLDSDSAAGASSADADDILSQLAGDEIDRLLAEADVEDVADAAPTPSTNEIARLTPTPIEIKIESESLDAVLDTTASSEAKPSSPFAADADAPPIDATALTGSMPSSDEKTLLALPEPAESKIIFAAPVEDPGLTVAAASDAPTFDQDGPYGERPLPFFLRPLAWMNAPFAAFPDAFREMLGKVAILTLFNAVAVLVYVLVFRR